MTRNDSASPELRRYLTAARICTVAGRAADAASECGMDAPGFLAAETFSQQAADEQMAALLALMRRPVCSLRHVLEIARAVQDFCYNGEEPSAETYIGETRIGIEHALVAAVLALGEL